MSRATVQEMSEVVESEKDGGRSKDRQVTRFVTENGSHEVGNPQGFNPEAEELDRFGCLCPEHLGEVVSFFCDDCTQSGCALCLMRDHHGHKKRYVGTEGVDEGLFGHTGIFFPPEFTIEGLLKNLNEDLQGVDLHATNAKEQIRECVSRHKGVLETQKRMLIDHVNAVKKAKLKYLQEQQKYLRKTLQELNSSVTYARKFLESDDHFTLLVAEKEITRRMAELNEKCSKITLPTERDWNLDKIKVIRDGKYVRVNRGRRLPPPPKPGMKTVHDPAFKATSVKLSFSMDTEVFHAFVRTCCHELGEKYWLRVR